MLHIKDDFGKGPVSQVSSSWFNAVAKFVNNLIGTRGIKVTKESDDMPTVELALKQGGGVGLSGDGEVCVMLHENGGISVDDESAGLKCRGAETAPSATHGASLFPDFTTSDQQYQDNPAWKMYDDITGLDGSTPAGWERGKTAYRNGHIVDEEHPAVGCSVTVCTHTILRTVSGTQNHIHYYSQMDFDENGLLVRVIPCTHWHRDA